MNPPVEYYQVVGEVFRLTDSRSLAEQVDIMRELASRAAAAAALDRALPVSVSSELRQVREGLVRVARQFRAVRE